MRGSGVIAGRDLMVLQGKILSLVANSDQKRGLQGYEGEVEDLFKLQRGKEQKKGSEKIDGGVPSSPKTDQKWRKYCRSPHMDTIREKKERVGREKNEKGT